MRKYRRVTSGSILYFCCTPAQWSEPNTVSKPTESQVHLLCGSSDSRQTWSNLTLLLVGREQQSSLTSESSAILYKGISHNEEENSICYGTMTGCLKKTLPCRYLKNFFCQCFRIEVVLMLCFRRHTFNQDCFFQPRWLRSVHRSITAKITYLSLSWSFSCSCGWPTSYTWPSCIKQAALPAGQFMVSILELPVIECRK